MSTERFELLKDRLQATETMALDHSTLEEMLQKEGYELLRQMLQDHLTLRARMERDIRAVEPVVGRDGIERPHRRKTQRRLTTVFGEVEVHRAGYEGRGRSRLHPLDAELNLPEEKYSHGVRRLVAQEAARSSYEETLASLSRYSDAHVPKRQAEELAMRAARDFNEFYAAREVAALDESAKTGPLLVLSVDGKGVPMRREGLREKTRKAAEKRKKKLNKRLSKGEKRHSKRMATTATVYTIAPYEREPADIVGELRGVVDADAKPQRPRPENKRVWASVRDEPAQVIGDMFAEALRRDPEGHKQWVALVDGNQNQLSVLRTQATKHGVELTIVLDIIHVIEYLWKAAWVFHEEGDPAAESWVQERLLKILQGRSSHVAAGIRRSATLRGLSGSERKPADDCARYLLNHRQYLHYDDYLAAGLPIATGVIEGACRYVVKDRMERTGARWGLHGAEAVLQLRSLHASRDFDDYWQFHLERERQRHHVARYAKEPPSTRQAPLQNRHETPYLQVVR